MEKVNVTVSFDGDLASKIEAKIDSLFDDATMTKIQQAFAETIDPWTPYLSGNLSKDVTVSSDHITYNAPYSRRKYYTYAYHKEVHPLATSHWDKVAMEQGAREILEARVREILTRRVNELYG